MKQTKKSLIEWNRLIDLRGNELYREYVYPPSVIGGEVIKRRIDKPILLIITDNGHRVYDGVVAHYMPYGWVELNWEPAPERPAPFKCFEEGGKLYGAYKDFQDVDDGIINRPD